MFLFYIVMLMVYLLGLCIIIPIYLVWWLTKVSFEFLVWVATPRRKYQT